MTNNPPPSAPEDSGTKLTERLRYSAGVLGGSAAPMVRDAADRIEELERERDDWIRRWAKEPVDPVARERRQKEEAERITKIVHEVGDDIVKRAEAAESRLREVEGALAEAIERCAKVCDERAQFHNRQLNSWKNRKNTGNLDDPTQSRIEGRIATAESCAQAIRALAPKEGK